MTWMPVQVGDLLSLEYGKSLPRALRATSGKVPVAGSNGTDGFHDCALIESPGIVVGRKGSAGKVTWFDSPCWPIDTTYFVKHDPRVTNLRWLYFLLKSIGLERLNKTTGVPGLNRTDAYAEHCTLPPPSEQRRIVEILDQADALCKLRGEADAKAARILPALFLKMFGDPATNPMGWPKAQVRDLATKYSDGPFGSNLKSSHYVPFGVRVIRLQNIGIGLFDDSDKAYISKDHFSSLARHECLSGDVLIGTLGDPNLRACIQPAKLEVALNKADCVQLRVNPEIATNEYVCWLLNMPSTLGLAKALVLGQTRTRISMGRLGELEVPRPPIDLQRAFSRQAQVVRDACERWLAAGAQIEDIFKSLLQRAFSGQLTAEWRQAHLQELLVEMQEQAHLLNLPAPN